MTDQVFVGREQELTQLWEFLDRAIDSQGQVCFVTGEAGSGKTALVTEFARRAQEKHSDLVVAIGQCDAHTGMGDPYLPFREVLSLLTGDVEAKLAGGAITKENASPLHGQRTARSNLAL
jgi:adenylate cyclase